MTMPDGWIIWLAAGFFFAAGWVLLHALVALIKRHL